MSAQCRPLPAYGSLSRPMSASHVGGHAASCERGRANPIAGHVGRSRVRCRPLSAYFATLSNFLYADVRRYAALWGRCEAEVEPMWLVTYLESVSLVRIWMVIKVWLFLD